MLHGKSWGVLAFFLVAMSLEVLGPSFYELDKTVRATDGYEYSCRLDMNEKCFDELDAGKRNIFLQKERLVDGNVVSTAHGSVVLHVDGHDDLVHGFGLIAAGEVTIMRLFVSAITTCPHSRRRCCRTGRQRQPACTWLWVRRQRWRGLDRWMGREERRCPPGKVVPLFRRANWR